MERIKDGYLDTIQATVSFPGTRVLEIGCGNGARTVQIAEHCSEVIAIDPNIEAIENARIERSRSNISYREGVADQLIFEAQSFDIVLFTLSFHHVPIEKMSRAINEALRVVKSQGHIIFLEPSFTGSFFDAEIQFDACDGDERKEKAAAYVAMLSHPGLQEIVESPDETIFKFNDLNDFIMTMAPKRNNASLPSFLQSHDYTLHAQRRINIFRPRLS